MNVEEIRDRLEMIVGKHVELMKIEQWREQYISNMKEHFDAVEANPFSSAGWTGLDSTWFFTTDPLVVHNEQHWAFRIAEPALEPAMRELIALLIESTSSTTITLQPYEEESEVQQLGHWLAERLEHGELPQELPDTMLLKSRLFTDMIPFLLICEGAQNSLGGYEELHQLLSTFLERDVLVIPLHGREWLLLVDRLDVLDVSEERSEEEDDRDLLEAFGLGLYELIASEWTGIFNLSLSDPLQPAHGLVRSVRLLRESVFLGKTFHVTRNVHLPWELGVERLVYSVPGPERERFMEEIEGLDVVLADGETLTTLETFFQMNSNVSETAKRLYVHRNTLIYRLDKVKQETGLDVRNFGDAVFMKLALLLDKVTKD